MDYIREIIVIVLGFIGGVGGLWAVRTYLLLKSGRFELDKAKRQGEIDEFREVIAMQREELDKRSEEVKEAREEARKARAEAHQAFIEVTNVKRDLADCQMRNARRDVQLRYQADRIKSLEEALTKKGIKFWPTPDLIPESATEDDRIPRPPNAQDGK